MKLYQIAILVISLHTLVGCSSDDPYKQLSLNPEYRAEIKYEADIRSTEENIKCTQSMIDEANARLGKIPSEVIQDSSGSKQIDALAREAVDLEHRVKTLEQILNDEITKLDQLIKYKPKYKYIKNPNQRVDLTR